MKYPKCTPEPVLAVEMVYVQFGRFVIKNHSQGFLKIPWENKLDLPMRELLAAEYCAGSELFTITPGST